MKKLFFVFSLILVVGLAIAKEPNIGKTFQAPPFEPREDVLLQQGFESGNIPTGWSQSFVNGTVDWFYQNGGYLGNPGSAHTGAYNAIFYYDDYTAYSTKLITPAVNLGGVYDAQLTFWMAMLDWAGDLDELHVYYKTSAGGNWVLLQSYISEVVEWTQMTINLPNTTSTYYIAFEGVANYGYGVCLDDVMITGTIAGNNLINEDFSVGVIPTGWTEIGNVIDNWDVVSSNYAGGTAPELEFSWSPSFVGSSYMTSPVLATAGNNLLYLSFRHFVDNYASSDYSLGVATTSNNGATWNIVYQVYPTGDIGPENLNLIVNTPDVGSNNFRIAFFFDGDSFNIDYWYIDDVILSTSTEAGNTISLASSLKGNYPNPFNPTTTIAFSMVEAGHVAIDVFNIKGEKVKTLVNGDFSAKDHTVVWNGTDDQGKQVASGVYFYKMTSHNYNSTRKMILMK